MAYNEADQKVLAFIKEDIAQGLKMRGNPIVSCEVSYEQHYKDKHDRVKGTSSFNRAGKYTGEWKNSKSDGKGTWFNETEDQRVDGVWYQGFLKKGRLIVRSCLEGYQGDWSGLDINKAGCKQRLTQVKIYYEKTKTVGESREPIFRKNRDWDDWR